MGRRTMLTGALRLTLGLLLLGATCYPGSTTTRTSVAALAAHSQDDPITPLPNSVPASLEHLTTLAAPTRSRLTIQHVTITLALRNDERLRQLVQMAGDPSSPGYRRFLSNAAFLQDYAPSRQIYDQ